MALSTSKSSILPTNFSLIDQNIEHSFEVIEEIGRGSFATVYKAKQKNSNKEEYFAIKKMSINPLSEELKQVSQLKLLQNDHIIEFYGYCLTDNQLSIVMNFCSGTLRNLINIKNYFTENKIINLLTQVTSAMLTLSTNSVMHLDLKPENILCQNFDYYKICDFGCAQIFKEPSNNQSYKTVQFSSFNFGTQKYSAPEIILGIHQNFENSCDIWSMGVIIYEIIFRKYPFRLKQQKYDHKQIKLFSQGKLEIEYSINQFPKLIPLLKTMLCFSPSDRVNWVYVRQYIKKQFKVHESFFISLKENFSSMVKMSLILFNVSQLIKENLETNNYSFWKQNKKILVQLRSGICEKNLQNIKEFKKLFHYKYEQKLNQEVQDEIENLLEVAKAEVDTCEDRSLFFQEDQQLLQNITQVIRLINEDDKEWISVHRIYTFCMEAAKIKDFFCKGHCFRETCLIFQIPSQI